MNEHKLTLYRDDSTTQVVFERVKHYFFTAGNTVLTVAQYTGEGSEHRYINWPRERFCWFKAESATEGYAAPAASTPSPEWLAYHSTLCACAEMLDNMNNGDLPNLHPLDGLHINKGSMDAASDAYWTEWQKSKCRRAYENRYHKVKAECPYDEWEARWFKALAAQPKDPS